jgi:hypothetical protein
LFEIKNAIPPKWLGKCKIDIGFVNPEDNWGAIGFKIKTYENFPDAKGEIETYLVD